MVSDFDKNFQSPSFGHKTKGWVIFSLFNPFKVRFFAHFLTVVFSQWKKRHFFVIFKFKIFTLVFNLQTCFIYQINHPDGYNIEFVFKITKIINYSVSQEKCQNRFFKLLTLSGNEVCPFLALRVNIIHFRIHMK